MSFRSSSFALATGVSAEAPPWEGFNRVAREENTKEGEKAQLRIAALAGALPQDAAKEALQAAEDFIERRVKS
jgi:hypothetical protein